LAIAERNRETAGTATPCLRSVADPKTTASAHGNALAKFV